MMKRSQSLVLLAAFLCGLSVGVHVQQSEPSDADFASANDALLAREVAGEDDVDEAVEKAEFDIDVVYTWVEEPKPESEAYKEIEKLCGMKEKGSGNGIQRFRDVGTFQYSLLSVKKYLPWVRKVWLVSERGTLPKWMMAFKGAFREKIVGISHKDLWPKDKQDKELPTHNSNAIETNLHKIPGLAEHFVYFNNDFFIGNPTSPSELFNDHGQAIYYDRANNTRLTDWLKSKNPKDRLKKMKGRDGAVSVGNFQMMHQAYPFLKSAMENLQNEKEFKDEFARVSAERCRPDDATRFMPFWFLNWYQIANNYTQVVKWKHDLAEFSGILVGDDMESGDNDGKKEKDWYLKQLEVRPKRFCVEDDFSYKDEVFKKQARRLENFLATYFGDVLEETGTEGIATSWKALKERLTKTGKDKDGDQDQDPEAQKKIMEVTQEHGGHADEKQKIAEKMHGKKFAEEQDKNKKTNRNYNKHQKTLHDNGDKKKDDKEWAKIYTDDDDKDKSD